MIYFSNFFVHQKNTSWCIRFIDPRQNAMHKALEQNLQQFAALSKAMRKMLPIGPSCFLQMLLTKFDKFHDNHCASSANLHVCHLAVKDILGSYSKILVGLDTLCGTVVSINVGKTMETSATFSQVLGSTNWSNVLWLVKNSV